MIGHHQEDAIRELAEIRDTVERQLNSRERQRSRLAEERDRARGRVGELQQSLSGLQEQLQDMLADRSALKERLDGAEQRLAAASQQRDAERQVEVGLRWHVARLEDEIQELRSRRETAQVWLKDWVLGSAEALEQLFGETGVDVEALIARAAARRAGQGGPLQVAAPIRSARRLAQATAGDPMRNNIQRLAALQRLARTLPLASPLDHF